MAHMSVMLNGRDYDPNDLLAIERVPVDTVQLFDIFHDHGGGMGGGMGDGFASSMADIFDDLFGDMMGGGRRGRANGRERGPIGEPLAPNSSRQTDGDRDPQHRGDHDHHTSGLERTHAIFTALL